MSFNLKDFKTLISQPQSQIVNRQFFYVFFTGVDDLGFDNNVGLYVQEFDLPNLTLDEDGAVTIKNPRGTFKVPGDSLIIPESNSFTINFLETEEPIIETLFVPWLEQVVNISKSKKYPFPRATVIVYILSSNNPKPENTIMEYSFYGTYPTLITLPSLNQANDGSISRAVTFSFDRTKVSYKGKIVYDQTNQKENKTSEEKNKLLDKILTNPKDKIPLPKTNPKIDFPSLPQPPDISKKPTISFLDIVDKAITTAEEVNKVIKSPKNPVKYAEAAKKINKTIFGKTQIDPILEATEKSIKILKGE